MLSYGAYNCLPNPTGTSALVDERGVGAGSIVGTIATMIPYLLRHC